MINAEVTYQTGAQRVLMVRFPRAKIAVGTGVVTVLVLGLPWLIVPFSNDASGLPDPAISLAVVLVLALCFGWLLVPLWITAARGGYLALAPTGVLIQTGLSSVHIPWTAISGASADTTAMAVVFTTPSRAGSNAEYPLLRVSIRRDYDVPGWPWPAALSPVLLGSSRRKLRIPTWWLQPMPPDRMVAIIRYLVSHPEERPRIGTAAPEEWLTVGLE